MNPTIPFIDEALDHSVIYEEYKGDFARARQIAEEQLTAARQTGPNAHVPLLGNVLFWQRLTNGDVRKL